MNELVRYWLTPVCGGYMPDASMGQLLDRLGIARERVKALRYRGLGCPGPTRLTMEDGATRDLHYLDVWGD